MKKKYQSLLNSSFEDFLENSNIINETDTSEINRLLTSQFLQMHYLKMHYSLLNEERQDEFIKTINDTYGIIMQKNHQQYMPDLDYFLKI